MLIIMYELLYEYTLFCVIKEVINNRMSDEL